MIANFDRAFTILEAARAEYSIHPDNDKLLVAFGKAKRVASSYSPGVPHSGGA